ncbi:hypothetical protein GCM10008066_16860 [Oxalicibacterium faecigallinarum]|uniref:Uncharacterized protein n=1 Tax=Oxalicibacterium faecigallinarum TaxID=573741 RepID=A0A8J3F6E6_9BURK|nr:hypothetical protein GCM10008066_16860 [Oxalicibacterium faecigallinarum]
MIGHGRQHGDFTIVVRFAIKIDITESYDAQLLATYRRTGAQHTVLTQGLAQRSINIENASVCGG